MEKKPNRLEGDELDEAVIAADDTGILEGQHEIAEEEILEHVLPEDETTGEEG